MLDCSTFCVERYAGMQCVLCGEVCWSAVRSVWKGMLDCNAFCVERYAGLQYVLCGEVCWTAMRSVWRGMLDCSAFCVERYAGLNPAYLSTQNAKHTHQTLCCRITTNNFHNFKRLIKMLNSVTLTRNLGAP
jgi:hypothetical protein